MKNNTKYILGAVMFILCSCGGFLEESSQDLMIPKSVKDFKELLYGEGLDNNTVLSEYIDLMTDDTDDCCPGGFLSNDTREFFWAYYTWQADPEVGKNNELTADQSWGKYYHKVLICNVILDLLDTMEGTESERCSLAGEAYFLRAYSYFMLLNLYGEPYIDEEQAKTALGVPVNDEVGVADNKLSRSSVAQVYIRIEDDLKKSIDNFVRTDVVNSIFRPNLSAAYLLASRVALYQKKYDEVVSYVKDLLKVAPAKLYDLNGADGKSYFLCRANTEILFSTGSIALNTPFPGSSMYQGLMIISDKLMSQYDLEHDLRPAKFFEPEELNDGSLIYSPNKWYKSGKDVFAVNFRLAEAYLNRAEAYAEQGEEELAMADLNLLRKHRFPADFDYSLDETVKEDAVKAVRTERRLELAFEGHRWFDLRRWDRPRLEHIYTNANDPTTGDLFVLEENDAAYTLPIPAKEIEMNPGIGQLFRPVRNPQQ